MTTATGTPYILYVIVSLFGMGTFAEYVLCPLHDALFSGSVTFNIFFLSSLSIMSGPEGQQQDAVLQGEISV